MRFTNSMTNFSLSFSNFVWQIKKNMKQNKHVLVIVDKAEKTASRNNKSDDLIVQWTNHMNTTPLSYQVIQMGLPVGDVWFCESEEPFVIPDNLKLQTTVSQTQTKIPFSSEVTNDVSENLFDLPVQTSAFDHLLLTTSDQTKSDKKKETVTNSVSSDNLPKPRIIVERKTVSDLLSSISDGRYHDQKCRLINSDAKSLMVLVEGYDSKNVKDATNKKKLLSSFSHTLFLDQICVYHTKNLTETFEFLNHTANELAAGKMERDADYYERTKYTDNIKMSRKANLTPDKGLELQLATVNNSFSCIIN